MLVSRLPRERAAGVFVGVILLAGAVASAEEVYKATLTSPRRLGKKTAVLTVTIKQSATEEDAAKLRKILNEQGSNAAIEALQRNDWGVAKITGGPSSVITYVRVFPGQNGSRVVIITAEPLYFPEDAPQPGAASPTRAVGLIQLEVTSKGKGRGTMAAAVKFRTTDEGVFQVEASRAEPIDLVDVQREK